MVLNGLSMLERRDHRGSVWRDILNRDADMWTLLEDPLGRALLALLTGDYGLPGDPQRSVLLHELRDLRAEAEARGAPAQVKAAIRSALLALRFEFPAAFSAGPTHPANAAFEGDTAPAAASFL